MPLEPDNPDETSAVAMERWKVKFKKYNEETDAYNDFLAHLYNLVMGQCTVRLEEHIKSHGDYESASQNGITQIESSSNSPTHLRTNASWLMLYVK